MCSNEPCGNGNCVNHCVYYTCTCYPGYGGNKCEIGDSCNLLKIFSYNTCYLHNYLLLKILPIV